MYVRVRLEQAQAADGIVLPQQAVTRSTSGDTVMVVGPDGKVAPRQVRLGPAQGSDWVVFEGLKAGEQVMVDGFQKLRGDAPVKAVPWKRPGRTATGHKRAAPRPERRRQDRGRHGVGPGCRQVGRASTSKHQQKSPDTWPSSSSIDPFSPGSSRSSSW